MKAASQPRRTLSFKEGLQEIKKTWGQASGQQQEATPQAAEEKRPHSPTGGGKARDGRARAPQAPRAPGAPGAKPQQAKQAKQAKPGRPGKPAGRPAPRAPEERQHAGQQPGHHPRPQQRQQRSAKPLPSNLSEADKARIERNRELNTVWNMFAKQYATFRERLPLKIGVLDDLCARHPDLERTLIVAVLKRHVNHPRYHERVAAGGARYELDGGASAGPGIEPSHIARANAALARQKAKAAARATEAAPKQQAAEPAVQSDASAAAVVASPDPQHDVEAQPHSSESTEPPASAV